MKGGFAWALKKTGVPYSYISDTVVRTTPNLRDKYDVIFFRRLFPVCVSFSLVFPNVYCPTAPMS